MANSRLIGRMAAQLGLSLEQLCELMGVDDEWAFHARRAGSKEIAEIAWHMTRPCPFGADLPFHDDGYAEAMGFEKSDITEGEERDAYMALARFARAVNEYLKVPVPIVPARPTAVLVTKMEETGDGESGPQVSTWYEVERRSA